MEPLRRTEDRLLGIEQELIEREPIFHRPEHATSRAALEAMTAPEFWEVGASGRRYGRQHVIETVLQRNAAPHEDEWTAEDFHCQEIAADAYLLAYTLHQGSRVTRRATLWRHSRAGWLAVYHQGTVVESP